MERRSFLSAILVSAPAFGAEPESKSLRGTLSVDAQGRPAVKTAKGQVVLFEGDEPTMLVLKDKRLAGSDFEALGHSTAAGAFVIEPIHTHSLFVYRNGKRLNVSYWCDICYIRTWSPGECWCCQEQTKLAPVDPATLEEPK